MSWTKGEDMDIRTILLEEFRDELAQTRKVLERIPEDKLTWKPHEKSMALGQLAMHVATMPGGIATMTRADSFDVSKRENKSAVPQCRQDLLTALDNSVQQVEKTLTETSADEAEASWKMMMGERQILSRPRFKVWRTILMNHWIHHRAQLTVYLRLLDVPVPAIYGPSADEKAF